MRLQARAAVIAQHAGGEAGEGSEPCSSTMTTNVHPLRAPACLMAAAAAFSAPVLAQPTLAETRVTATRFAEPGASLPFGVSVITADEIRASGASSVNDAIMRLLGAQGRQDLLGGGEYGLDLRGFGTTADNNQLVILDGVRISEADLGGTRLSGIPIDAVERIEVLRGSGAVLYGEGATGGVIVITTKAGAGRGRPSGGSLYGAAGSHGLREARGGATVSAGSFTLDADGQARRTHGWRENSAARSRAGTVTGQWSSDWLRLGARLGEDEVHARLPGPLGAAQYEADPRQTTRPADWARLRSERAALFATADLGAWQLAFDAAQRDKVVRSMNGGFPYDYDVATDTYALRARHEGTLGGVKNALVLGVDVADWRREVLGAFGARATQQSRGFYVKDDVTLRGGTRLSAGARAERVEKDNSSTATSFTGSINAWELGVSHPFGAGWTGYARVGHSFRFANVDEFNFTTPGVDLRPQRSRDVEVGARWAHAKGELEARLYRSALTDEIGYDPNAVGPNSPFGFNGANINFDPTRRQGLELDWKHAASASFTARVHAAWRKATFRSGPYADSDVPLVPRRTLAVRGDWTPVAGHRLSGGVNWVSSQHPDFANTCTMPSYTTADARYAWQLRPNAELALGVANLFDRKYSTQAFGCAGGQTQSIYPEPGRQFTASLRMQF